MSYDWTVADQTANYTNNCGGLMYDYDLRPEDLHRRRGSVVARMIRAWDKRLTDQQVDVSMWDAPTSGVPAKACATSC